jgi:hypothetical protein
MANKGYVTTLLNALDSDIKKPLQSAFDYVLDNVRIGTGTRAVNMQWYRVQSTTSSTGGVEFSIQHGMGVAPTTLIPVLDVGTVGAQLVPLEVSRAADAERIYLKSTSTSAVFVALLEA